MNKAKEPEVLQPDLADLCHLWQTRLRLRDWNIEVRFVGHDELEGDGLGRCLINKDHKKAIIKVLREEDRSGCDKGHVERTLIHELLHLHFEAFWDDAKKQEMETTINILSAAFAPEI